LAEDPQQRDHDDERREEREQREERQRGGPVEQVVVLELRDGALERGDPGAAAQLWHEVDRVDLGVERLALGWLAAGGGHGAPARADQTTRGYLRCTRR
jgi:hypothetical protein